MLHTAAFLLSAAVAPQPELYLTLNVASYHIDPSKEFNQSNPGLGINLSYGESVRASLSTGFYLNSYNQWSTYVIANVDARVINLENVDIYAGAWAGFAEYPNLVDYARNQGFRTIGDHITVIGLSVSAKFKQVEAAIRYLPTAPKAGGILTLSFRIPLTR